ncbi:hypothetical protein [Gilvimarinus chinensis]|uniref:hypothetical protein n=1 Tax=Gilvimarinus chinensis TaxID=396005 RepID=UPI00037BAC09|nr:hypothetical protein [Gilvimarinus chinensis]
MTINRYYQYVSVLLAFGCIAIGVKDSSGLLIALGCILLVGAVATIMHLKSGKHNPASKLPKDFKVSE